MPLSLPSSNPATVATSPQPNPPVFVVGYTCHRCRDMGWVYTTDNPKHPEFGKVFPCECKAHDFAERRRQHLLKIDGLQPDERLRKFENFVISDDNRRAYQAVTEAITKRRGMITLTGGWGMGKTELLTCAVNKARNAGIPAVYATTAHLMDHLRQAYKPGAELDIDERWNLLTSAEVLAVDELEKFNTTEWALERFSRLIDERWRSMGNLLTLLATNAKLERLPGDVFSRLQDGRAQVVNLAGPDMRPFNQWDDSQPAKAGV